VSLTLAEARDRAACVSGVSYVLDLDLSDPRTHFRSRTTVRFTCSAPATFLELTAAEDLSVTLDGAPADASYDGRRLHLRGLAGTHELVVDARLPYVTDGEGIHRMVDPADGRTYLGAYLGLDVAQRVFCCFDQNDLKAPISLTVTADPAWTVLANGRAVVDGAAAAGGTGAGSSHRPRRSRSRCCAWSPARGRRCAGSTPGCRSAGTPARPWPGSSSGTPTSSGR
jgi:aminopeptidase N